MRFFWNNDKPKDPPKIPTEAEIIFRNDINVDTMDSKILQDNFDELQRLQCRLEKAGNTSVGDAKAFTGKTMYRMNECILELHRRLEKMEAEVSVELRLENIDVKSIEFLGNHRCNITFNVLDGYKDYYVEYVKLCNSIQNQLKYLEPWYVGGSVENPLDAVNALKAIDKLVKL